MKNILTISLCSDGKFFLHDTLSYKPIFDDSENYVFAYVIESKETAITILNSIMEAVQFDNPYTEHDVKEMFLLTVNDITYLNDINYISHSLGGNYNGTKISYYKKCLELV